MGCRQSKLVEDQLGKSSTADDVIKKLGGNLSNGKTIIVTGGNTGLGLETARCLAANGASVIICSRNVKNGEIAKSTIVSKYPDANVSVMELDLGNHGSIRRFVNSYLSSDKPLHVLINNAGVMAAPRSLTSDGLELQIGTNHVGHHLLTTLLLPVLEKSGNITQPARVINVSSMGNYLFSPDDVGIRLDDFNFEKNYNPWIAYGQSKLANILFTRELNRRMVEEGKNVISVSLHPGAIMETELKRHFNLSNQIDMIWKIFSSSKVRKVVLNTFYKNTAQGAATSVYCSLFPKIIAGEHYADCDIHSTSPEGALHPFASDNLLAQQLWKKTEEVIASIKIN